MDIQHNIAGRWSATLVDTGEKSKTGGRVKHILAYVSDEPFPALTHGDGVADIDLRTQVAVHRSHGRMATVTSVRAAKTFGAIQNRQRPRDLLRGEAGAPWRLDQWRPLSVLAEGARNAIWATP
ncbi:hypothetical protein [Bradyrhizobium sp. BWA-3-5]|uniref:hypothetical protein n=1 Tax=Bradyrhizobium sp. BWA-3-5 TaxID=3080013 RepID=UPI00293F7250|nr:hypothetical protein [Bradyrhizobium sp. BWA-3-5]WOH63904.1 hypothetical protein RX331_25005 [Bradyrhizobium sp. BWA-3-5]